MDRATVTAKLVQTGINRETVELFLDWLKANPEIWQAFQARALQAIRAGVKHWGAKAIFETARFDAALKRRGAFKVNNNYAAYMGRLFILKYPSHQSFFEFRTVKGLRNVG